MPNEVEQAWWERFVEAGCGRGSKVIKEYNFERLIEEATRRGKMEAWEAMRSEWPRNFKIVEYCMTLEQAKEANAYSRAVVDTIKWLDAKLSSLSQSPKE